jgi:tetratricopeptide (TPR) repeat protein
MLRSLEILSNRRPHADPDIYLHNSRRCLAWCVSLWVLAAFLLAALPTFFTLAAGAAVTAPNGTDTNPLNLTPEVQAAFQHFYDLDYGNAEKAFQKIAAEHPTDPMAVDYLLNNTVFRELYRLDLLDTTLYVQDGFLSGKHPVVEDMRVRPKVEVLYNRAIELSNEKLRSDPNDVDALFARGYATSLETVYVGMVEKKYVPALKSALSARKDDDDVLKLDPKYVDCYLIVGVHDYVLGSLALPFKILAGMVGIHGSKSRGVKELRSVGQNGIINSVSARTALAIFLRREAQYAKAIEVVDGLHRQYPHNFLFSLEEANLLKDSGQGAQAIAAYQGLLAEASKSGGYYSDPHLEMAYYGLGEAARGQQEIAAAAKAYESAAAEPTASPLMQRRAHLRAGEMRDLLGQHAEAKKQYDAVLALGEEFSQADSARKFEQSPYTDK